MKIVDFDEDDDDNGIGDVSGKVGFYGFQAIFALRLLSLNVMRLLFIYRVSTKTLPSLFFGNISIKSSPNPKSNLLVLRISKLSLIFHFGQVEAEIFKLLDTRGHFQFSHFHVILCHFSG